MTGQGGAEGAVAARLSAPAGEPVGLKRALGLWHAVLFGLGVTIGAGIYVLIGATAGRAGLHAPLAFVIAAKTYDQFAEAIIRKLVLEIAGDSPAPEQRRAGWGATLAWAADLAGEAIDVVP